MLYSYLITLHYIFSYMWGDTQIGYMHSINLKNLICVDIVKCQAKVCPLLDFLYRFLTNLPSTGGLPEISRWATCCPWAGQHCSKERRIKHCAQPNKESALTNQLS